MSEHNRDKKLMLKIIIFQQFIIYTQWSIKKEALELKPCKQFFLYKTLCIVQ